MPYRTASVSQFFYNLFRPEITQPFPEDSLISFSTIILEVLQIFNLNSILNTVHHLRLRNDLYCVEWGVKLYSLTHCTPYLHFKRHLLSCNDLDGSRPIVMRRQFLLTLQAVSVANFLGYQTAKNYSNLITINKVMGNTVKLPKKTKNHNSTTHVSTTLRSHK